MGAQHFAVQAVAFEVADDLTVEVDLMQVAAAVVQAVEPAPVRQLGLDQVAEFVVVMLQLAAGTLFGNQLADSVVGESQCLGIALQISEGHSRELIHRIVAVLSAAIVGGFGDQSPERITLQPMNDGRGWRLGHYRQSIAIRRRKRSHRRDVVEQVVVVVLGAAVEVLLLGQPIPGVPCKPIAFTVLVDQRLQPPVAVIPKLHLSTMGVGALTYLATPVVLVERGVPGGVGVAHQLPAGVALIQLGAPIR